jgi:glycerophosphoryl diester phosphodiesterase
MKKNNWRTIAILALLVLFLFLVLTPGAEAHPYYDGVTGPLVIAHQGGDGVWPGDTLYAFEKAVEIGADVLEMDAHITKDGYIVLMHDETVDRYDRWLQVLIEEMTLAELKQLDAGVSMVERRAGRPYPLSRSGHSESLRSMRCSRRFPQIAIRAIEIKLTKNSN